MTQHFAARSSADYIPPDRVSRCMTVRDGKGKLRMACRPLDGDKLTGDMTKFARLFTKSVLFAHPYMVTDSTMAHRQMLRQVLNRFELIKSDSHSTNNLFNPNKELLGFYNSEGQSRDLQEFDGADFVTGDDTCVVSVARVIRAVER